MRSQAMRRGVALFLGSVILATILLPVAQAQLPPLPVTRTHHYATYEQELRALVEMHSDVAKMELLGKSVAGLNLWRIDVGQFDDPDFETLPALLVDGGHHGNEFSGVEAVYYFLEGLLMESHENETFLDGKRVVAIPVVNPDGWVRSSRTNTNGVNLNRNYPWMWDARGTDPAPHAPNYAGPSEGSEPETKLVMSVMDSLPNLRAYISYHCCGPDPAGEVVLPWDPDVDAPIPDWPLYEKILADFEETGVHYRASSGTGESISHAYGNLGVFSVIPETPSDANDPILLEDPRVLLAEMIGVSRYALENLNALGAHLVATPTENGVTEIKNVGFGTAYNVSFRGHVVSEALAPGESFGSGRLSVESGDDCPAMTDTWTFERVRIAAPLRNVTASLVTEAPPCQDPAEDLPIPGISGLIALSLLALAAMTLRRRA